MIKYAEILFEKGFFLKHGETNKNSAPKISKKGIYQELIGKHFNI